MPQQFFQPSYRGMEIAGQAFSNIPTQIAAGVEDYRKSSALNKQNDQMYSTVTDFFDKIGVEYDPGRFKPRPEEQDYDTRLKTEIAPIIGRLAEQGADINALVSATSTPAIAWDSVYKALGVQKEKKQQDVIGGAVGRAMQPRGGVTNEQIESRLKAAGGAALPPEQYANQLMQDLGSLDTKKAKAPGTQMEFSEALRQELPYDVSQADLDKSAQYRLAAASLPGAKDELAQARLALQQKESARKAKRDSDYQKVSAIKNSYQQDRLDFDKYKLGLSTLTGGLDDANAINEKLQAKIQNQAKLEAEHKKLKEMIRLKSDDDGAILNEDELDIASARMAEVEMLIMEGKAQKQVLENMYKETFKGAFERGKKARRQSGDVFNPPAQSPSPAPSAPTIRSPSSPTDTTSLAKKYGID